MMCCYCEEQARKHGRDRKGNQRFTCKGCKRTFLEERERPLLDMRIDHDKAVMVLKMLAEGCADRSIEPLTDRHRNTICRVLVQVGARCQVFMEERIVNVQWTVEKIPEKTGRL